MRRRNFFAVPLTALQLASAAQPDDRIIASGDGVSLTPDEFARLLAQLTANGKLEPDSYSLGGVVAELEKRMAEMLGKETAVWMPTGTLANHVAVRLLAGNRRRVLVQAESHLNRDCGDCAQTLSGLNLVGLAPGKASFTLSDVQHAATDAATGRVLTPIGAIQIETPVRRMQGERFDFDEMRKICAWAREQRVGTHLDGARLFLESAYTKRPVREYAAMFDTVYISLYKYFNSGFGAILAGPKSLLADVFYTRRMFGAGLPHVWPNAAIALHYVEGFEQRFRTAVETSEQVIAKLRAYGNFEVQRVPNGTNIFSIRVPDVNPQVYLGRLETAGITVRGEVTGPWIPIQVNETWNRASADAIAGRFHRALS